MTPPAASPLDAVPPVPVLPPDVLATVPHDAALGEGVEIPAAPTDTLLDAIFFLLAPLFLGASTELGRARLAAIETVAAYHARSQGELVCIAQIIAFGMAALDNLRLSMLPELSVSMKLRLRGCANGLNRSAQQNTRALDQARRSVQPGMGTPMAYGEDEDVDPSDEEIRAKVAEAQALVTDIQAQLLGTSSEAEPDVADPVVAEQAAVAPAAVAPTLPAPRAAPVSAAGEPSGRPPEWLERMMLAERPDALAIHHPSASVYPLNKSDRILAETLAGVAREMARRRLDAESLLKLGQHSAKTLKVK